MQTTNQAPKGEAKSNSRARQARARFITAPSSLKGRRITLAETDEQGDWKTFCVEFCDGSKLAFSGPDGEFCEAQQLWIAGTPSTFAARMAALCREAFRDFSARGAAQMVSNEDIIDMLGSFTEPTAIAA